MNFCFSTLELESSIWPSLTTRQLVANITNLSNAQRITQMDLGFLSKILFDKSLKLKFLIKKPFAASRISRVTRSLKQSMESLQILYGSIGVCGKFEWKNEKFSLKIFPKPETGSCCQVGQVVRHVSESNK